MLFTGLQSIGIAPKPRLDVLRNIFIEEVPEEISRINIGEIAAEATAASWRNRPFQVPLAVGFALQSECEIPEALHKKAQGSIRSSL